MYFLSWALTLCTFLYMPLIRLDTYLLSVCWLLLLAWRGTWEVNKLILGWIFKLPLMYYHQSINCHFWKLERNWWKVTMSILIKYFTTTKTSFRWLHTWINHADIDVWGVTGLIYCWPNVLTPSIGYIQSNKSDWIPCASEHFTDYNNIVNVCTFSTRLLFISYTCSWVFS